MQHTELENLEMVSLFDLQPEPVMLLVPVFEGKESIKEIVVDFKVSYCNGAYCRLLNKTRDEIIGSSLLNAGFYTSNDPIKVYEQIKRVYATGLPHELNYRNSNLFYHIICSRHNNNVLIIGRDVTHRYQLDLENKKHAERYQSIINSSPDGILLLESIRNKDNEIEDFYISHCNAIGLRLARFPTDAAGKTLLQTLPHLTGAAQYNLHKQVVKTGEPVQFDTSFRNEKGEEYGWFMVSLQKMGDGVLSRFVDLTNKKKNEENAVYQANLVNSILDASFSSVFALKAVRDENDKIIDFTFLIVNERFAGIIGKDKEYLKGKSYLSTLKGAIENGLFHLKVKVIETGIPYRDEIYYKGNGVDGWFNISLTRLGKDGIVQSFTNITESKKDKERLRTIINTSHAGMFTLNPIWDESGELIDFKIGILNQAVADFFNKKAEDIIGVSASVQFPKYKQNGLFELYKNTFLKNTPHEIEFFTNENGEDSYFEVRTTRMNDELLVTFTNYTQLKKLQIQLQKSIRELERSNKSLEEFTSAASHDLKEPIRKINFFVNMLKSKFDKTEDTDPFNTFEKLETATRRMIRLVDDLLEYSHLSYVEPELETVDLNQILIRVQEDLELVIQEKKAIFETCKLPVIKGHNQQLLQLFQNLISNSLKYTAPDTPPIITIKTGQVNGSDIGNEAAVNQTYHLVQISDNGIGFDQKYAERIFNIFERLHGKHQYKGSGVGLSIARKVVENHHGFITAFSTPGEGATFKIYLPF